MESELIKMLLDKYKDQIKAISISKEDLITVFCVSQTIDRIENISIDDKPIIIKIRSLIRLNELISNPTAEMPIELGPIMHFQTIFDPQNTFLNLRNQIRNISPVKIISAARDAYNKAFAYYLMATKFYENKKLLAFKFSIREFAKHIALMVAILNNIFFKTEYEFFMVKRLTHQPSKYHRLMAILFEHELASLESKRRSLEELWKNCKEFWERMLSNSQVS